MADEPTPQFHHPDVWRSRDRPVLMTVVAHLEGERGNLLGTDTLAAELSMPISDVARAIANLERGGYVTVKWLMAAHGAFVTGITERALTETGLWPDNADVVDRLLWIVEQRMTSAGPDERGQLAKFRDGLITMGRELTVDVLGAALTGRLPM